MDLAQRKLTKAEWEGIEIPVNSEERKILRMIKNGFNDTSIVVNDTLSLYGYMKIDETSEMTEYLYEKYISKSVDKLNKKYNFGFIREKTKGPKIKKKDIIRIDNFDTSLESEKKNIFEYIVLELIESLVKNESKGNNKFVFHYYTIYQLNMLMISNINHIFKKLINYVLTKYKDKINIPHLLKSSPYVIEHNVFLWKYANLNLYKHQKDIFSIFKNPEPKMVLYIAPTATGKTLTPIGLAEKYRVIFVCAARHVGLALAKSAISSQRKIALAFNCGDAEDIRLHYAAAKDVIRNKRTGGIKKVDNSNGENVEMIISDITSYLPAMYYMLAFNPKEKILLFWDEPTITMDYESHSFHEIIKKNWTDNLIQNIVLSSATLPKESELNQTIGDYKSKFGGNIYTIISHDCKKTIPLIEPNCSIYLPHKSFENYQEVINCATHLQNNKTLLRYLDLGEIVRFVDYVSVNKLLKRQQLYVENYFPTIENVNMYEIKQHYILVLQNIIPDKWSGIYEYFNSNLTIQYPSNIHMVSKDAYTLTDGPTIFLANNIEKIAQFCLKEASIPESTIKELMAQIEQNTKLTNYVNKLERDYDDLDNKENNKDNDRENSGNKVTPEMNKIKQTIDNLITQIRPIMLDNTYIPNRSTHLEKWAKDKKHENTFTSDVNEDTVIRIAKLTDIDAVWKILLIMGIGVFTEHPSIAYTEIMKELAESQKLFMIIASSDYIYGTNYQFCHGYISKDLSDITQEKAIQAMGRIGRNKMQQQYSIRFRTTDIIKSIFIHQKDRPEVNNMNRLFCS